MIELSLPFFSMFLFGLLISLVFKGRVAKMFIFTAILALIVEFAIILYLSFPEVKANENGIYGSLVISNLILTFLIMAISSSGFVISLCKVELLNSRKAIFCQALGLNYAFMALGSYTFLLKPILDFSKFKKYKTNVIC